MDLLVHLRRLLAPLDVGSELAGARLVDLSAELGLRLTFRTGDDDVCVELAAPEPGERFAVSTPLLGVRYRAGYDGARVSPELGMALCRAVAEHVKPREEAFFAGLRAAAATEHHEGSTRIREITVGRVLEPAGPRDARYFTVTPYVGCVIGCRFCYAQSRTDALRRLEMLPPAPWGSYVDVRVNAAEILARELATAPALPVKFCPIVSDPYQAVERRYALTRRCLEALRDAAPRPVLVLTRSMLVERDVDVFASMPSVYVGASIPTVDDEVRRHFEPRGASIDDRLGMLRRMRARGIATFAVVQPLLPGDVLRFAEELSSAVTSVSIDVLRGEYDAADEFADPRYAACRSEGWQRARAEELARELERRGVRIWRGELPPEPS